MRTKNYLILCAAVTVAVVLSVLFVPGLSDTIEGLLLLFLSTSAR